MRQAKKFLFPTVILCVFLFAMFFFAVSSAPAVAASKYNASDTVFSM